MAREWPLAVLERGTQAQSTAAFEGKVMDTDSGSTIAMFADKEFAMARPIDLKGFTWYANAPKMLSRTGLNNACKSPTGVLGRSSSRPVRSP